MFPERNIGVLKGTIRSPKRNHHLQMVYFCASLDKCFLSDWNQSFFEGNTSLPDGDYMTSERVYKSVARSCTRSILRNPDLYKSLGHHGRLAHVSGSEEGLSDKKLSGKKQTDHNFDKNDDTFNTRFARHVSVVQRPSLVESIINLKLHLNL